MASLPLVNRPRHQWEGSDDRPNPKSLLPARPFHLQSKGLPQTWWHQRQEVEPTCRRGTFFVHLGDLPSAMEVYLPLFPQSSRPWKTPPGDPTDSDDGPFLDRALQALRRMEERAEGTGLGS